MEKKYIYIYIYIYTYISIQCGSETLHFMAMPLVQCRNM